jgi:hypothetical protein
LAVPAATAAADSKRQYSLVSHPALPPHVVRCNDETKSEVEEEEEEEEEGEEEEEANDDKSRAGIATTSTNTHTSSENACHKKRQQLWLLELLKEKLQ